MAPSPTQVVLGATLFATLAIVWYYYGRGRWRAFAETRLLYGVPWGTLVTVAVVVAFYLFAQNGLWHWSDPVVYPFVSWSYFYPLGLVTAGIAHSSPAHIVSNLTATLVLAPIAEFAWGHYASDGSTRTGDPSVQPDEHAGKREAGANAETDENPAHAPGRTHRETTDGAASDPAEPDVDGSADRRDPTDDRRTDGGRDAPAQEPPVARDPTGGGGLLDTPWVRAVVLFPAALLGAALLTAVYSLGPGLGFSGAVYAILGFAIVTYPATTVVGVVVASALGVLYEALTRPVVTTTVEVTTPSPPSWAGIGFQAHALGFLLGVVAAVALLAYRRRSPGTERVFFATLLVGLVQSLWLLSWGSGDTYTLYRGAGVIVLLVLTLVVAAAARTRPSSASSDGPSGRFLAMGWLLFAAVLVLGALGTASLFGPLSATAVVPIGFLAVLLLAPGVLALLASRVDLEVDVYRKVAVLALVAIVVLVALPSVLVSSAVVPEDPVPNQNGSVTVGEYTVTYVADEPIPRELFGVDAGNGSGGSVTGVVVVNQDREIGTIGVQNRVLRHEGEGSVPVGGVGWRESIRAERTAWNVAGGETAYAIDLFHDGDRTRSYTTHPVTAAASVAGASVVVVPVESGFQLRALRDDTVVDEVAVPPTNETTGLGDLEVSTRSDGDTRRIYASGPDSRALIAVEETY